MATRSGGSPARVLLTWLTRARSPTPVGSGFDNALMESFWSRAQVERRDRMPRWSYHHGELPARAAVSELDSRGV